MERDPLADWPAFAAAVRERLEAGRAEYGDASFDAEPAELVREINEELMDVCAWSYILHARMARLTQDFGREATTDGNASQSGSREAFLND